MNVKSLLSGIDVNKFQKDFVNAVDSKTDGLYSDLKSGNVNMNKIEKQMGSVESLISEAEEKLEPITKLMEAKEQIDEIKEYIDDPVAKIKDEATSRIKDFIIEKVQELPVVEDLKNKLKAEAEKKLMEIPEVKELKETYDEATNAAYSAPALDSVMDVADDPEQVSATKINIDALIERAIHESGLGATLLRQQPRG